MSIASVSGRNRIARKVAQMPLNTRPYRLTRSHDGKWIIVTTDAESRTVSECSTYAEANIQLLALNAAE